jgi:hypothetical protein
MRQSVPPRRPIAFLAPVLLIVLLAVLPAAGSLLAASGLTRTEQALQEADLPARDGWPWPSA